MKGKGDLIETTISIAEIVKRKYKCKIENEIFFETN